MVALGPDSHTIEKEGNGFNFKFFIVEKGHKYNTNEEINQCKIVPRRNMQMTMLYRIKH